LARPEGFEPPTY